MAGQAEAGPIASRRTSSVPPAALLRGHRPIDRTRTFSMPREISEAGHGGPRLARTLAALARGFALASWRQRAALGSQLAGWLAPRRLASRASWPLARPLTQPLAWPLAAAARAPETSCALLARTANRRLARPVAPASTSSFGCLARHSSAGQALGAHRALASSRALGRRALSPLPSHLTAAACGGLVQLDLQLDLTSWPCPSRRAPRPPPSSRESSDPSHAARRAAPA